MNSLNMSIFRMRVLVLKNVFWTTISEMLMLDFKIEFTFHMFAF